MEALLSGEEFFMQASQSAKVQEIIQAELLKNLLHYLPTVKSWYIIPLDSNFNTSLTISKKENTVKAFGGKWHEKALVECLAGAYKKIWSRTEVVVEKSLRSPGSNTAIANFLGISHIPNIENNLPLFAEIAFNDKQKSLEMFSKIRALGREKWGKELLTRWLWLDNKDKLTKIKKDLEIKKDEDRFEKLIYFQDESIEEIALREFIEESGYTIQDGSFTPYLTFVEVKFDESGNRYLKERLYAFWEKGVKIKDPSFSQSEAEQGIEPLETSLKDAVQQCEKSLMKKFWFDESWKKVKSSEVDTSKRSTVAANYLAIKTAQYLVEVQHIQGRKF